MKSILTIGMLSLLFLTLGMLIGHTDSSQPLAANEDNNEGCATALSKPLIQQAELSSVEQDLSHEPVAYPADESEPDISIRLSAPNADDRLNALYFVWRNHMAEQYRNEIARLANEDTDLQVISFAQWVLGEEAGTALTENSNTEITLTDFNSPDDQLKASLIADSYRFQQTNQQQNEDQRLLDKMPQLTEEEQLSYIKELSESQEDAAVSAD